jgi:hypothetical protein
MIIIAFLGEMTDIVYLKDSKSILDTLIVTKDNSVYLIKRRERERERETETETERQTDT